MKGGRGPARATARRGTRSRLAAIGLTALLEGLWLEWCLEPGTFRPGEAWALCEAWVDSLVQRMSRETAWNSR